MTALGTDADWPTLPGRTLPPVLEPVRTGLIGGRVIEHHGEIRPGCCVWSSRRSDWQLNPVGGVVVSITETRDAETGEVGRAFLTLNPYSARGYIESRAIRAEEIGPDGAEEPVRSLVAGVARRLARQVADGRGALDDNDAEWCAWLYRLAGVSYDGYGAIS